MKLPVPLPEPEVPAEAPATEAEVPAEDAVPDPEAEAPAPLPEPEVPAEDAVPGEAPAPEAVVAAAPEPVVPQPPYTEASNPDGLEYYFGGCCYKAHAPVGWDKLLEHLRHQHKVSQKDLKGTYLLQMGRKDLNQKQREFGRFGDVRGAVSGAEAVFGPILAPHARTVANDFLREQERYLGL